MEQDSRSIKTYYALTHQLCPSGKVIFREKVDLCNHNWLKSLGSEVGMKAGVLYDKSVCLLDGVSVGILALLLVCQ